MNKYIVRTSLAWIAVIAIGIAMLHYQSKRRNQHTNPNESEQLLAAGPPAPSDATSPHAEQPSKTSDAALAPIQLTSGQMQAIGVEVGTVEYKDISNELRVTGTVAIDERRISYVQVRYSGYIRKVFADAKYDYLKKGEPLFTIYSPDLFATEQEYLLARQNQKLMAGSSVEGVASGAVSLSQAAEQRLRQWDIPQAELSNLQQTAQAKADLTITSQVSGYITERNAVPNMYVDPSTRLYTVADLSSVWVNAQVFQDDVGALKPGDSAAITVDAYPQRTFRGRVEQVLPQVDMATRTVPVRLAVANPTLRLKPGMFVDVSLKSGLGRQLTVPASAVFQTGTRQIVFLDQGSGTFTPQTITTGAQVGEDFVVLSGLQPHQKIVTSANFLLDSESQLQAAAGAPVVALPVQTSSGNEAGANVRVDFTTEPAPPHKGTNIFQVELTNSNGAPVDGATVAVTFYMPAMPAMGMTEMKTSATLASKGTGIYQGRGDLGSGGSWQVTVTAQKNGRTIATKQMRVDADGGM